MMAQVLSPLQTRGLASLRCSQCAPNTVGALTAYHRKICGITGVNGFRDEMDTSIGTTSVDPTRMIAACR